MFDDIFLTVTQLFQVLNCSENLVSDTEEAERLEEENKGHIVLKAIWSRQCLLVIIWCADVPTHLRHCCPSHPPTVGRIGSGVHGHYCFDFFPSCNVLVSKSCPQVDVRLPLCKLHCTHSGGQKSMFCRVRSSFSV